MDNQLANNVQVKEIPKNDTLKVIAIISMLIDHIGYGLFPNLDFLRIVGRLAFPIFAYNLTIGYINTGNLRKYSLRILTFALISQIPYSFFAPGDLNIMFTLLVGLGSIYCIDKKRFILLPLPIVLSILFPIDYGIYGLAMIVIFYVFRDNPKLTVISNVGVTLVYVLLANVSIQMFCILSLFLILRKWKLNIVINKYFFYIFYPAHIVVIMLIAKIF